MLTTGEILAGHEAALASQNPDRIAALYAKDAVVVVNGAMHGRPEDIARFYAALIRDLPTRYGALTSR